MTPAPIVQAVIDAEDAHRKLAYGLSSLKGEDYEQGKRDEQVAWNRRTEAKRALRDHVYRAYGVDLPTLDALMRG